MRILTSTKDEPEPFVQIWRDLHVPRAFTAILVEPEAGEPPIAKMTLDVEIEDGHPRCRRLEIEATDGNEITGETLRLPIAHILLRALTQIAHQPHAVEDVGYQDLVSEDVSTVFLQASPFQRVEFYGQYASKARRPRRGSPVTDDHLKQVAELYRAAMEQGDPPTQTIADEMHVARSTAARWVGLARKRGHLGASIPGRAGEGQPEDNS